jgi:hypothetical protein
MRWWRTCVSLVVVTGLMTVGAVIVPASVRTATADSASTPVAIPPLTSVSTTKTLADVATGSGSSAPVVGQQPTTPKPYVKKPLVGFQAGQSTEMVSGRTATVTLFKNPDGSLTQQVAPYPVHYHDAPG